MLLAAAAATLTVPATAYAAPTPVPTPSVITRADHIAGHLARDPVFITDAAPRDISPRDAARIRAAIRRMPVPTYAAVIADVVDEQRDPQGSPERLIALLHDELGRNGVYLVVPSSGIGITAEQFGQNLPLEPASREVTYAEPYDAGAARVIERFVDDIRSGQAQARYEKVYARSRTGWEPKPYGEDDDLAEEAGVYSGTALALLLAAGIGATRLRRARRRR